MGEKCDFGDCDILGGARQAEFMLSISETADLMGFSQATMCRDDKNGVKNKKPQASSSAVGENTLLMESQRRIARLARLF